MACSLLAHTHTKSNIACLRGDQTPNTRLALSSPVGKLLSLAIG